MKLFKTLACGALVLCCSFLCFGCGPITTSITLGTYAQAVAPAEGGTFTPLASGAKYSLEIKGTNLILKGTVPYSDELEIGEETLPAGHIVAIRFKPSGTITLDDETSFRTTDPINVGDWIQHDKENVESDGSVVWLTNVFDDESVQIIKIKWNKDFDEVMYTLSVDESATLTPGAES